MSLRVITNQTEGTCDASEVMISAYCTGGDAKLHASGIMGAACDGDPAAKVVVVCAKR